MKLFKPTSQKWKEVVGSNNALATFLAFVILILGQAGVELPSENPEEYFGELQALVSAFIVWIVNPIRAFIKRVLEKQVDWKSMLNSNTVTAFVSIVGVILGIWFSEETVATLVLIITNVLNFGFQLLFQPAKMIQA